MTDGPLIVQSDKTLLLEVDHPGAEEARRAIAPFAELERAPEHVHTYRLTPLGLWNARAAGHDAEQVVDALLTYSRYPGAARPADRRRRDDGPLRPAAAGEGPHARPGPAHHRLPGARGGAARQEDPAAARRPASTPRPSSSTRPSAATSSRCCSSSAGRPRTWPATSTARPHPIVLDESELVAAALPAAGGRRASGTAAPASSSCPAAPARPSSAPRRWPAASATTLILVTNTVSARQWKDELLRRTSLTEEEIGEYSGAAQGDPAGHDRHLPGPDDQARKGVYPHLELLDAHDWGLIIYDEVHLLPAPIFRMTADLQARRRLGLTATLVREDGREGDVFSLIGPKRYDAPWKDIEAQGYIAPADCVEVRVTLPERRADGLRHGRAGGRVPAVRHVRDKDPRGRAARGAAHRASRRW